MEKYRQTDDGTLVSLALLGEEGAFDELVERHEKDVKRTALRIVGNPFSAEDAAQDAFLAAWNHLAELRYPDKFGVWILRIAENRARTLVKRYGSRLSELRADMDELGDPAEAASFRAWEDAEAEERVREAVDALGGSLRDTVRLHYLEGYGAKEIADMLGIPEGTVWSRLYQGRKVLRKGFGIPEDGRDGLVSRVKRQIEGLKRLSLRNDKTGLAETYGAVLTLAEGLDDSPEKTSLLADALLFGSWWIPGRDSEALRARIRAAALESRNEEVMMSVAFDEAAKFRGDDRIRFIRERQIPALREAGFEKTLGASYFWLGHALAGEGRSLEAVSAFGEVTKHLPPSHPYYACAVSALRVEVRAAKAKDPARVRVGCMGEVYEKSGGKWIFADQPGYTRGHAGPDTDAVPFFWLSRCDGLIDDPAMGPGDARVSEDGKVLLMLRKAESPVTVPAGTYGDCLIYETKGESFLPLDIETVVCPGVGIVKQTDRVRGVSFLLTAADVRGTGRIPFVVGNRWTYRAEPLEDGGGVLLRDEQTVEIVYATDRRVTASVGVYAEAEYDASSWKGNMAAARDLYHDGNMLRDVEEFLLRAGELARTPRERIHTAAASDVMRRIFRTDPVFNPDWTERGVRNFFKPLAAIRSEGEVLLRFGDRSGSFEWKAGGRGPGYFSLAYNFLYEIVSTAWGVLWSDGWTPGFSASKRHMILDRVIETALTVGEDEAVSVPAGEFSACRTVRARTAGYLPSFSGLLEFWYAPGVGLVKFRRTGTAEDEEEDAKGPFTWELTAYRGTGAGYFPLDDGLIRRYEPADQPLPDGYRGWVEYAYSTDETGTVIFKNASGTQDRKNCEIEQERKTES